MEKSLFEKWKNSKKRYHDFLKLASKMHVFLSRFNAEGMSKGKWNVQVTWDVRTAVNRSCLCGSWHITLRHHTPHGTIWYPMVPKGTIWYHIIYGTYGTLRYHFCLFFQVSIFHFSIFQFSIFSFFNVSKFFPSFPQFFSMFFIAKTSRSTTYGGY